MSEDDIRALRDFVYEERISDDDWKAARLYWMDEENVEFLKREAEYVKERTE